MINGLGRWSESLDRAVFMLTLSSPLIINHQSVLNSHLRSPVSSVSERQVIDRAYSRSLHCNVRFRFLGFIAQHVETKIGDLSFLIDHETRRTGHPEPLPVIAGSLRP